MYRRCTSRLKPHSTTHRSILAKPQATNNRSCEQRVRTLSDDRHHVYRPGNSVVRLPICCCKSVFPNLWQPCGTSRSPLQRTSATPKCPTTKATFQVRMGKTDPQPSDEKKELTYSTVWPAKKKRKTTKTKGTRLEAGRGFSTAG